MTRIIGGRAGGQALDVPRGRDVRPTLARVREAIMSMLDARRGLAGAVVLDLFAGSGALGLEAWSRGAAKVTLVDQSGRAARAIARNMIRIGAAGECQFLRGKLPRVLERLPGGPDVAPVTLVLMDPPYDAPELATQVLEALPRDQLAVDALVLVEHDGRRSIECPAQWSPITTRNYGDTAVTLFERVPTDRQSQTGEPP